MLIKMEDYCKFCELLVKELNEGSGHFDGLPLEIREQYLDSMNKDSPLRLSKAKLKKFGPLMPVVAHCRGVGLCSKHAETIKRDNKIRAKKDMNIPTDLSISGKLRLYDWVFTFLLLSVVII